MYKRQDKAAIRSYCAIHKENESKNFGDLKNVESLSLIHIYKGITVADIVIGFIALLILAITLSSNFGFRWYIAIGIVCLDVYKRQILRCCRAIKFLPVMTSARF